MRTWCASTFQSAQPGTTRRLCRRDQQLSQKGTGRSIPAGRLSCIAPRNSRAFHTHPVTNRVLHFILESGQSHLPPPIKQFWHLMAHGQSKAVALPSGIFQTLCRPTGCPAFMPKPAPPWPRSCQQISDHARLNTTAGFQRRWPKLGDACQDLAVDVAAACCEAANHSEHVNDLAALLGMCERPRY